MIAALEEYKRAILNDDGKAALRVITRSTVAAFEAYRQQALTASRGEVDRLGPMSKMMVLLIRHRIPAAELRKLDGGGLFVHAVNSGWVGKQSVSGIRFGEAAIDGDFAAVTLTTDGKPSPLKFEARREQGTWRFDVSRLFKLTEPAVSQMLTEIDPDPNTAILKLVGMVAGNQPGAEIWQPPGK